VTFATFSFGGSQQVQLFFLSTKRFKPSLILGFSTVCFVFFFPEVLHKDFGVRRLGDKEKGKQSLEGQ